MCGCERALELISLGLDGLLTGEERRELEEHLDACEKCRSLARELEQVRAVMDGLEEEVPEGFHAAVMDRVRTEKAAAFPAKRWENMQKWVSMAAAFAVVLIGAGTLRGYLGGMAGGGGSAAPAAVQAIDGAAAQNNAAAPEADGVTPFSAGGGESAETAPPGKARMAPAPRGVNDEAQMDAEPEAAAKSAARAPTGEERETMAANCAAWVLENGYDRVDAGLVAILPVTRADLEAAVCGAEAQGRMGLDDWRVTVGDAAGQDYIGLICDDETLEVLGYIGTD